MATVSKWTPFDVALDITATGGTVTRTSATKYTVKINASWETYYSGALTNYGMTASSGGGSVNLNTFGVKASKGSGSFTGTYSISGNGSATKTITVTFKNYNNDNGKSATKAVSFNVTVPAWTSYKITYNANGGSGAPGAQTKWKDQTLTLSSTKPIRSGYSFLGWSTSSSATSATYAAGASYKANAAATLYAVWKANTYTVTYNANGGSGTPGAQTKTHGVALTLSSVKPTRANYTFKGWATSTSTTTVTYASGATYTTNAAITLYAVWELSYVKPVIKSFTVNRCNSGGTTSDEGTYALVKFTWTCSLTVKSIIVEWKASTESTWTSSTISASGTTDTTSVVIGEGNLSTDSAYSIRLTVTDANDSSTATRNLPGMVIPIDVLAGGKGVSVGKPAELEEVFDVGWDGRFRKHICIGDKTGYHDGNQGVFLSWEGFLHLQRTTEQGYHPYIGFYLDDSTNANGLIRLNSSDSMMQFSNASGYHFDDDIIIAHNEGIRGYDANGTAWLNFQPKNTSGNTIVGYANYSGRSGSTNIYGVDLNFGVANIANPGTYRPYRRRGDTSTLTLRTAGYVTNGGKDISFWIPFSEPIIGSPTVTVTSGSGFVLRQGNAYTHGSSASTNVTPDSYEATATMLNGVYVKAVFSNTTNVTNNDSIGIYWNGTITFS